MRGRKEKLEHATSKAVTTNLRGMAWPVFESYVVRREHEGSVWIVAPAPPLKTRRSPAREGFPEYESWSFSEQDRGMSRWYAPLRRPDLLLRLAELGESGRLTPEKMQAWASEWGLLGVSDDEGREESLQEFGLAVWRVTRNLRLYEASTAPGGTNTKRLEKMLDTRHLRLGTERTRKLRDEALEEVHHVLEDQLRTRTFLVPYRLVTKETRDFAGFDEGRGFHNLLGAAYILMLWLMKASNTRRVCKRAGCSKIIDFEALDFSEVPQINPKTGEPYKRGPYKTRADKEFCSSACKRNWRYHNVEKVVKNSR